MKRSPSKTDIGIMLSIIAAYALIYVVCERVFFIGRPNHMYTPDWTAKNILWIAAAISAVPALFSKKVFPFVSLMGYISGVVAGELFGEAMVIVDPDLAPMPVHYGWVWCIAVFTVSCIVGAIIELYTKRKQLR